MKSFKNFLKEEFSGAFIKNKETIEVFSNPYRNEIESLSNGARFIIDFQSKIIYVWDINSLHYETISRVDIPNFSIKDYNNYSKDGIGADRFFLGHGQIKTNKLYNLESDSLTDESYFYIVDREELSNNLNFLLNKDKYWLSKYFKDVEELNELIKIKLNDLQ